MTMPDNAIVADHVSKLYQLGARARARQSFREKLTDAFTAPYRLARDLVSRSSGNNSRKPETIWALHDISFQIGRGEVVGLIGRNGAGKSTLLKILSRITEPTRGWVEIRGRVGSLLEVGTGFHPELSGRENVFLNGAILGMKRAEIQRKFDEIVAFAEIERFIDTAVKHYSSGMYLRLAFAVAAHLEPQILLVDEVLAVGDAEFQKKCLGKMESVAQHGRTVVLVSHNMGAIQGLCKRALLVEQGGIIADGKPADVVGQYLESVQPKELLEMAIESLHIEQVVLRDGSGAPCTYFPHGSPMMVDVHYRAESRIEQPYFWIAIFSKYGSLMSASMLLDGHRPEYIEGRGVIRCVFSQLPLLPQLFTIRIGVRDKNGIRPLVKTADVATFRIAGAAGDLGLHGEIADADAWESSPVLIPYEWYLPDGRIKTVRVSQAEAKTLSER
jgi:lipopolysaccharide transport system ATP-binding protein